MPSQRIARQRGCRPARRLHRSFRRRRRAWPWRLSLRSPAARRRRRNSSSCPTPAPSTAARVTLAPAREEAYRIYGAARGAPVHGVLADQPQRLPHLAAAPLRPRLRRRARRLDVGGGGRLRADHGPRLGRGRPPAHAHEPVLGPRRRPRRPLPALAPRGPLDDDCGDRGFRRPRAVVEMPPALRRPSACRCASCAPSCRRRRRSSRRSCGLPGTAGRRARRHKDLPLIVKDAAKRDPGQGSRARSRQGDAGSKHVTTALPAPPATTMRRRNTAAARSVAADAQTKTEKRTEPQRQATAENLPRRGGTVVPKIINRQAGADHGRRPPSAQPSPQRKPKRRATGTPQGRGRAHARRRPCRSQARRAARWPGQSLLSACAPSSTTQALAGFSAWSPPRWACSYGRGVASR